MGGDNPMMLFQLLVQFFVLYGTKIKIQKVFALYFFLLLLRVYFQIAKTRNAIGNTATAYVTTSAITLNACTMGWTALQLTSSFASTLILLGQQYTYNSG